MKSVLRTVALCLPLSAGLSSSAALFLDEAAAAFNIPQVPKVQNSDADGFPVLPEVGSFLTDVSRSVQGLSQQANVLQEELRKLDQTSAAKLKKQKAAYDQLLRRQERANQKIQAKSAERAKMMMGVRDAARKTQADIREVEAGNNKQREELKSLQDHLRQVQQATEDALSGTADAKAPSGAESDLTIADEDAHARQPSLSFLQVKPKELLKAAAKQNTINTLKASTPAVTAASDEDDDYGAEDDKANEKKTVAKVFTAATTPALRSQAVHATAKSTVPKPAQILDHNHQSFVGDVASKTAETAQVATTAKAGAEKAVRSAEAAPVAKVTKTIKSAKSGSVPIPDHRSDNAENKVKTNTISAGELSQSPKVLSNTITEVNSAAAAVAATTQPGAQAVPGIISKAKAPTVTLAASRHPVGNAENIETFEMAEKASEYVAVDDKAHEITNLADALAPVESQETLAMAADDQSQASSVDGQMAQGVVASLSKGLKMVQEQVHQSEAKLKLDFQKAYRAGKKRHDALIEQSEALEKAMRSMQAQERKMETALAKLRATDKVLKQKIDRIVGFLGAAIAPFSPSNAVKTA